MGVKQLLIVKLFGVFCPSFLWRHRLQKDILVSMGGNATIEVPKVRFREPERNLPGRKARAITAETRFTIRFAKAYIDKIDAIHHGSTKNNVACARQVAVNGFGITDLIFVAWKAQRTRVQPASCRDLLDGFSPTVRSFEVKMRDWRRGMTQAHRYRYFSNAAILVLPADASEAPRRYLDTFRRIKVGLWDFDPISGNIRCHFTPRPHKPFEPKYMLRALQIVSQASRVLPVLQRS